MLEGKKYGRNIRNIGLLLPYIREWVQRPVLRNTVADCVFRLQTVSTAEHTKHNGSVGHRLSKAEYVGRSFLAAKQLTVAVMHQLWHRQPLKAVLIVRIRGSDQNSHFLPDVKYRKLLRIELLTLT